MFYLLSLLFLSVTALAEESDTLLVTQTIAASEGPIPQGAQRVPMLSISITAPCSHSVEVQGITLTHAGLGSESDIVRVYATEEGRRISRSTHFSLQTHTADLRYRQLLKACEKRELLILADFSPDASIGGEHRMTIKMAEDVETTASEVVLTIGDSSQTQVTTPSSIGTVAVEYLPLRGSVTYGTKKQVMRIKLEADNESDQVISSILLTNNGKARDADIQNLYFASASGLKLTNTMTSLKGDQALMTFSPPLQLSKNSSKTLVLYADIRASRRKTIQFIIEEPSDVFAMPAKGRRN